MKKTIMLILFLCVCVTGLACAADKIAQENIVNLRIYDRIVILDKLPVRGTFDRAVILKDIRNKIELTQEELEKYEIAPRPSGGVGWNEAGKTYVVTYIFTELEVMVLKETFKQLDAKKEVPANEEFLELYKKIKELK